MADVKVIDIKADTVEEFMKNAASKVAEGGELGITNPVISLKWKLTEGKISTVDCTLKVSIKRPRLSGGNPDDHNKEAIEQIVELIKNHEAKHEQLAKQICDREFPKAKKALVGKTEKDGKDTHAAILKMVSDAYKALDKKEGKITPTRKADGSFTIKQEGI
jgi:predicted secreted Zn-dependent protease